jgi:hypothetical protein
MDHLECAPTTLNAGTIVFKTGTIDIESGTSIVIKLLTAAIRASIKGGADASAGSGATFVGDAIA